MSIDKWLKVHDTFLPWPHLAAHQLGLCQWQIQKSEIFNIFHQIFTLCASLRCCPVWILSKQPQHLTLWNCQSITWHCQSTVNPLSILSSLAGLVQWQSPPGAHWREVAGGLVWPLAAGRRSGGLHTPFLASVLPLLHQTWQAGQDPPPHQGHARSLLPGQAKGCHSYLNCFQKL